MKTVIDLNDEALALAAKELGTTTKKDTVNAALEFVANRRRRIEQLLDDPFALGVGPDITDRAAATCVTVDLGAGYSGRDVSDLRVIAERRRALYVVLPISEAIAERARDVQVRMAARGHHRAAGVVDLLTAAVAEHHGAVVLHYDADFEHIAATTGQPHAWIVPRGIDRPTGVMLPRPTAGR